MYCYLTVFAYLFLAVAGVVAGEEKQVRVACVGDSITSGEYLQNSTYPLQLGEMLGQEGYRVENYGVSACTASSEGDKPYDEEDACSRAIQFQPDIVIVMLGTNDSKANNWEPNEVKAGLKSLVKSFQELPNKPKIFLCTPMVATDSHWGINPKVIREDAAPMIRGLAEEMKVSLIDVFKATDSQRDIHLDGIHPNQKGAKLIAQTIRDAIKEK